MWSPQVQKAWSLTLQNNAGEIVGYADVTPRMHDRIAASKIFQGTLTVSDASHTEIATIDFSRQGTTLAFPGKPEIYAVRSPLDQKDSMAFFQYEERIQQIMENFARVVIEHRHNREEMQDSLSEKCRDLIDPKGAPDHALAVSVTLPGKRFRG